MSRRYLYAGLGVLTLAAALAISPLARWGWGSQGATGATVRGTIDINAAVERAKAALASAGYVDLAPSEIMEFSNHFYVLVKETGTGRGALELIVERNGFVHPEPGPNMMWNTKYGHMAGFGGPGGPGMMGPGSGPGWSAPGQPPAQTITQERARQLAAQYLATASPGATPDAGTAFYGYFTFDAERNGTVFGMLSVNAYTGQVWYHAWHGRFIQEKDL